MRSRIVRIGNSRGIRIPKSVLEQTGLEGEVELEVKRDRLIVRPAGRVREGWGARFEEMARRGDDEILLPEAQTAWDEEEWEW